MTVTPYDFTRPLPLMPDVRANLAGWLRRANTLAGETLAGMGAQAELAFQDSSTEFPAETLLQWTDRTPAFQVNLDEHDDPSVIAFSNPLAQDLVSRLLGETPVQPPAERDLTPAEMSIVAFVAESIVRSLQETWHAAQGIKLTAGVPEPNLRRTRLFSPVEPMVVCRSSVVTPRVEGSWCWLMTSNFVARLFGLPTRTRAAADPSSRRHLERLVGLMRAEMEVRLGTVQLTGPQLARLHVGDVVVLDQRVSEPLRASLHGEPKFLGWAGRVGNRQAFEIESEVPPRSAGTVPDVA